MPVATVDTTQGERFELSSLEGGYVVLRRLNYGEKLKKQEMQARMQMEQMEKGGTAKIDMQLLVRKVAEFEFNACIKEHNLEDENGNPLLFSKPRTLDVLNPQVGEEIGDLIASMNDFEGADSGKE